MKFCSYCNKHIRNNYSNYCDFGCQSMELIRDGGVLYRPNYMQINTINCHGLMSESEHGDHPDYKFPIIVEPFDIPENLSKEDIYDYMEQRHSLIYTDGIIALTLYENRYYTWNLHKNKLNSFPKFYSNPPENFRISKSSLDKIYEYAISRMSSL